MDWDKLKLFHAVAEAGNFTKATYILNLSQSAISRQIQSLEKDLRTQLFERHARGLSLTENGEYLFKTAHEVISKLKEVETTFTDKKDKPSGKLTVETHLLDCEIELYGEQLELAFLERLRDEIKFESTDALATQIAEDVRQASNYVAISNENVRYTADVSSEVRAGKESSA